MKCVMGRVKEEYAFQNSSIEAREGKECYRRKHVSHARIVEVRENEIGMPMKGMWVFFT